MLVEFVKTRIFFWPNSAVHLANRVATFLAKLMKAQVFILPLSN